MTTVSIRVSGLLAGFAFVASAAPVLAGVNDIFIDPQISVASCNTYNPATRTCGGGIEAAYRTIGAAAAAATPGNIVHLRGGTYSGQALVVPTSGTASAPITYQRYTSETPILTGGMAPAISLDNRSYIIIDGITVQDVGGWLSAENATHNVIKNSTFLRSTGSGTSGGVRFVRAEFNKILNNRIDDGPDDLTLIHSDRNLVQGNTISRARHNVWAILCGSHNVIRGNDFDNYDPNSPNGDSGQKLGQITDCEGTPSAATFSVNDTKHNLVEGNIFRRTGQAAPSSPYAGIQYAAQQGIIRGNRFHDGLGPGIQMTLYSAEAQYNTDNRIYQNVFYNIGHGAIDVDESGGTLSGNIFKNNILHQNYMTAYGSTLEGQPVQIGVGQTNGIRFERNNIIGATGPNQLYVILNGRGRTGASSPQRTLTQWQSAFPAVFANNLEVEPRFTNEAGRDFTLASGSAMIDAGTFLTQTTTAGSGSVLRVADAIYFYDGFGIPGETGDEIQLEGQSQTARIVEIDYGSNTLTLDRALTWTSGQRVALKYAGTAPDIGAFEFGGSGTNTQAPGAPANVRIIR